MSSLYKLQLFPARVRSAMRYEGPEWTLVTRYPGQVARGAAAASVEKSDSSASTGPKVMIMVNHSLCNSTDCLELGIGCSKQHLPR